MLVEVVGQEIGISGAVFACDVPCVQPLSTNVPFLPVPADRRMQLLQARLCCAMRHGFNTLYQFYSEKQRRDLNPALGVDPQAGMPYPRTFKLHGQENDIPLVYTSPLSRSPNRMLFLAHAQTDDGDDATKVVLVKFCPEYNEEAHRVAAGGGFAPKLYSCEFLDCGFYMVVMDFIDNCSYWGRNGKQESETSKALLRSFLSLFAGHDLVHGDLRGPNVLVKDDDQIFVIDFDWAGKHGVARYPVAVNREENWAEGVEVGRVMKKEHDEYCIRRLLGE